MPQPQTEDDLDSFTELPQEEHENNSRIKELKEKQDRTDAERQELQEREEKRKLSFKERSIMQRERVKKAEDQARQAEERARQADERAQRLESEFDSFKKQQSPISSFSRETITIDGKNYLTDRALKLAVERHEMSEDEAYSHQQERIEAKAAEKAYQKIKQEQVQAREKQEADEDLQSVYREYPQFDPKSPKFNPNDPLLKESVRLIQNGYRRASDAVKDAKRILRVEENGRPDMSDHLSVHSPSVPKRSSSEDVAPNVSEDEKEAVYNMYRNQINPATNRNYTQDEAVARYIKAKKAREASRRVVR